VRYFVQKLSKRMDKKIDSIPTATMKALRSWSWPGNVRELENFLERSVILTSGPALCAPLAELKLAGDDGYEEGTLREIERRHIVRVLKETRGVIAGIRGAAVKLGVKRTTLQSRMHKLKIDRHEYLI
jgi:formate hydrogenlyase transcriptional activator